jgi:hypothetical protein
MKIVWKKRTELSEEEWEEEEGKMIAGQGQCNGGKRNRRKRKALRQ